MVEVTEPLEPRFCLAIYTSLDEGLLIVQATKNDDIIAIDDVGDQLTVQINNSRFTAPSAEVRRIRILAGAGNDRVTITQTVRARADIYGGDGNDYLAGGARPCRLFGEAGHDTLVGGANKDVLSGGPGIDTVDYSARTEPLKITLDGKANDGTAPHTGYAGECDNVTADVENVRGGSGDDSITGNAGRNTLRGGPGNDTLVGLGGDDVLVGGPGADKLLGGDGDDLLIDIDGSNMDTLDGGDGYDSAALDSVGGVKDTLLNVEDELSVVGT